jgi:hypothetical protein
MKHQAHFESVVPTREAARTTALIADLNRIVQLLNADIAAEEDRTRISDPTRPEYPMIARALIARRDNLLGTISALEQRLDRFNRQRAIA